MACKRIVDDLSNPKTLTIEFHNGQTFGPIDLTNETDKLTMMIGALDVRLARLEDERR